MNKFLNTGLLSEIYKNELDKVCFQHDMDYNKHKELERRTQSDIVLKNKAYKRTIDPKVDGYQRALVSMVWKFFDKRSGGISAKGNSFKKVLGSGIENK